MLPCSITSYTDPSFAIRANVIMFSTKDLLQQFIATFGILASTIGNNCLTMTACAHKFRILFYCGLKISNALLPFWPSDLLSSCAVSTQVSDALWPCMLGSALIFVLLLPEFLMLFVGPYILGSALVFVQFLLNFLMLSVWPCMLGSAVVFVLLLPEFLMLFIGPCILESALVFVQFLPEFLMLFVWPCMLGSALVFVQFLLALC